MVLRLICGRLQCHVSGARVQRRMSRSFYNIFEIKDGTTGGWTLWMSQDRALSLKRISDGEGFGSSSTTSTSQSWSRRSTWTATRVRRCLLRATFKKGLEFDREDCFGRATVALTRAIRHRYIVSPIDMAGMIGMAQTSAVYHYGYHTLKKRLVQYHEPAREPSDAEAVLGDLTRRLRRKINHPWPLPWS